MWTVLLCADLPSDPLSQVLRYLVPELDLGPKGEVPESLHDTLKEMTHFDADGQRVLRCLKIVNIATVE